MKRNDNQSNRIFSKSTNSWFSVTEEEYRKFDRWRTALRKRMQYHGKCFCPRNKWWLCDGLCEDCEFYDRNTDSLDDPLPDGEGTRGDYVSDSAPTPEEIISDRDLLKRLIKRLHEIDPDADQIIQIWKDNPAGISDRKVAKILGRKQRTFADEMKKFRDEFKEYRNK